MAKDPVQALVDEITLIRGEVKQLQRTSLSKDEAKALNSHVAQALAQMKAVAGEMSVAASEAPQAVRSAVRHDLVQIDRNTSQAASRAAEQAVEGVREHLDVERLRFAQAAGEARREAWRSFGGLWAWLAAMLATGALLGALAALWMTGKDDAREFGRFPRIYCEDAGGTIFADTDSRRFCGIWIDPPVSTGS
jgi:hypothetical protein